MKCGSTFIVSNISKCFFEFYVVKHLEIWDIILLELTYERTEKIVLITDYFATFSK
jgi:hypothetical protein